MTHSKRDYKVRFRFVLYKTSSDRDAKFMGRYMPKWSRFMRSIMSEKLLPVPTSKNPVCLRDLPDLRKVVPSALQAGDVIPLILNRHPDLARLLMDAAPVFDLCPQELKVHILAVCGVNAGQVADLVNGEA